MRSATLTRRFFLAATPVLAVASPAGASVPDDRALRFRVFRKGSEIGTHQVSFVRDGGDLHVAIAVDFAVGLGPIVFYRYTLRGTETWRGGVLMEASSDTTDGGKKAWLRAARQNGRMVVEGSKTARYVAPEASIVSSHWNRAELAAPMINLQNGELLDFTVQPRGPERIEARGRIIPADHFALTGPATINLWYDEANIWRALKGLAEDGSLIAYQQA